MRSGLTYGANILLKSTKIVNKLNTLKKSRFDRMMIRVTIRFRNHRILEQESSHRRDLAEHENLHTVETGSEGIKGGSHVDRYGVLSGLHLVYTRIVVVQDIPHLERRAGLSAR